MKNLSFSTPIEPLLNYFDQFFPLKQQEKDLVAASFHPRLYRKRHYILQEGDICTQFNFIIRGCLRIYKVDDKGNIHILQFAPENHWVTDLSSYHNIKPSVMAIDALEDTVVFQISRNDLISLYQASPRFDRIFRVLIEKSFIRLQERLLQNISSRAEERYQSFLELYPQLSNRLSQVQIAAYLGLTPEFISRLRNTTTRGRS